MEQKKDERLTDTAYMLNRRRMCKSQNYCFSCPFWRAKGKPSTMTTCRMWEQNNPAEAVKLVQEWAEQNPEEEEA